MLRDPAEADIVSDYAHCKKEACCTAEVSFLKLLARQRWLSLSEAQMLHAVLAACIAAGCGDQNGLTVVTVKHRSTTAILVALAVCKLLLCIRCLEGTPAPQLGADDCDGEVAVLAGCCTLVQRAGCVRTILNSRVNGKQILICDGLVCESGPARGEQ